MTKVVSGFLGYKGAKDASKAEQQAAAADREQALEIFNRQVELQEPFREAGLTAQNRLLELLGLSSDPSAQDYGSEARDFEMGDFTTDPGYQFRLKEGMKALDRSAASRGQLLSGSQVKAAQRYNQGLASDEYDRVYNRRFNEFQTNRTNRLNPLQSLIGASQTATNVISQNAGAYGNRVSNAINAAGNARASGYIGKTNALRDFLNDIGPSGGGGFKLPF